MEQPPDGTLAGRVVQVATGRLVRPPARVRNLVMGAPPGITARPGITQAQQAHVQGNAQSVYMLGHWLDSWEAVTWLAEQLGPQDPPPPPPPAPPGSGEAGQDGEAAAGEGAEEALDIPTDEDDDGDDSGEEGAAGGAQRSPQEGGDNRDALLQAQRREALEGISRERGPPLDAPGKALAAGETPQGEPQPTGEGLQALTHGREDRAMVSHDGGMIGQGEPDMEARDEALAAELLEDWAEMEGADPGELARVSACAEAQWRDEAELTLPLAEAGAPLPPRQEEMGTTEFLRQCQAAEAQFKAQDFDPVPEEAALRREVRAVVMELWEHMDTPGTVDLEGVDVISRVRATRAACLDSDRFQAARYALHAAAWEELFACNSTSWGCWISRSRSHRRRS